MRALEVDPEDRYRSADQFFMALESFVEDTGLVASARRISAFMADLDIEGAVALTSDEEDEFDDLGEDETLDFGEFEAGAEGGAPPSWVTEASGLPETDGRDGRGRGRTMTLASLTTMVEESDLTRDASVSGQEGSSGSSMHAIVREEIADEASSPMTVKAANSSRRRRSTTNRGGPRARSRRGSAVQDGAQAPQAKERPRDGQKRRTASATPRSAATTALTEPSFGGSVMASSGGRSNAGVMAIVGLIVLAGVGYLLFTIMGQK